MTALTGTCTLAYSAMDRIMMHDKYIIYTYIYMCVCVYLVSLCNSSSCPGTRSVDQAGLECTEIHLPLPPGVLGLKACVTIT